jgi:hypothetical protein
MNIFYLDHDVTKCAEMHNDKHVVKMILEYAQLLSTAHRVLDGVELSGLSASGRKKKFWTLADSRDYTLYKATHIHHPSAVWARQSAMNYYWLYTMLDALCKEYTYRYGKIHKCERDGLVNRLQILPSNIKIHIDFTEPTPAMPDEVKVAGDSIKSYRNYYINNKTHLASWKKRSTPGWYNANI